MSRMLAHERSTFVSLSSLSSTSTSQVTLPTNKHCDDPQNEEYGSVAKTTSSTGYEPNVIDNSDYSETFSAIFQNESVDIATELPCSFDAELDDELHRKALSSPLFTQEREEPANLRQTYHSQEESLLPAHTSKNGKSRARTKFKFVSETEIKSRPGKRANQDSPWKTKGANSCWSQIWDPEARTSSRVWQKKYPEINWNWWLSANGKLIILLQDVSNPGEINYYFKKKYQNKIGIFVKHV